MKVCAAVPRHWRATGVRFEGRVVHGSQTVFTAALLPIREFGLTRTEFGFGVLLATIALAVGNPLAG